jgi:glycosyltransferase involved in cell wall biosynthesis
VGFVGRLVHQKGVEYFIETAKEILEQRNDVMFVIIGSGPDVEKIKMLVAELNIIEYVLFLGYRKDAVRYMKIFDVMLFTSRFEPFGLVLAEAMAARVPIVAMDVRGAVSEIIRPFIDGIVIKGADCSTAAKSVSRLLDDRVYRDQLVTSARERVTTKFTLRQNAQKVYLLYKKLCLLT